VQHRQFADRPVDERLLVRARRLFAFAPRLIECVEGAREIAVVLVFESEIEEQRDPPGRMREALEKARQRREVVDPVAPIAAQPSISFSSNLAHQSLFLRRRVERSGIIGSN
jgi:hypothetical protein